MGGSFEGEEGGGASEAWRWLGTRQHGQTKKRAACTSDARTVMDVRAERCVGDDPYGVWQPASRLAWPWLVIVVGITLLADPEELNFFGCGHCARHLVLTAAQQQRGPARAVLGTVLVR